MLLLLSGCASITPVVSQTATADASSGYVAGLFTRPKPRGFAFENNRHYAFEVKELSDGRRFMMPLGEESILPTEIKDQTVAIKLPPGRYTVFQWITYDPLTKEILSTKPIIGSALSKPFDVTAGSVVHLGGYDLSQSVRIGSTLLQIKPRRFSQAEVQKAFGDTYPNLASQAFRCVLCADTVGLPASQ